MRGFEGRAFPKAQGYQPKSPFRLKPVPSACPAFAVNYNKQESFYRELPAYIENNFETEI